MELAHLGVADTAIYSANRVMRCMYKEKIGAKDECRKPDRRSERVLR